LPKAKAASNPVAGRIPESAKALPQLLKTGLRAEQAFARLELNFVSDRYLSEKMKHPAKSLP
jgi:hypothetical protein